MTILNELPLKVQTISVQSAKQSLGLTNEDFGELLKKYGITKTKNSKGKASLFITDFIELKKMIRKKTTGKFIENEDVETIESRSANFKALKTFKEELDFNVRVNVRDRNEAPQKAIIFAGPTNSGKTYHGLEELFADFEANPNQVHVYCGPLRLLAFEVYNKMVERYGEERVGFITGEEAINPEAKLLATTCEMAPSEGASILVDETHWLAEPNRGHIWSRILISSKFKHFYIISAAEAIDVIQKLTEDAWHSEIRHFERKTPIIFKGGIDLKDLPNKTAVVCFSRKTVYTVAKQLEKIGKRAGVLYGGLPLKARKRQIQAYLDGKYDIMVTTDVIGHGINLPIDNVVFAQTQKFDGHEVRDLYTWELAQIAGRAGRFGLSQEGGVYLAQGLGWFSNDKDLVKLGTLAAGGKSRTDLIITEALVSPRLNDLGLDIEGSNAEAAKILPALEIWKRKANDLLKDRILKPSDLATQTENIVVILKSIGAQQAPWSVNGKRLFRESELNAGQPIDLTEMWQLASGPFDPNLGTIHYIARWLTSPFRDTDSSLKRNFEEKVSRRVSMISKLPTKEAANQIEILEESIRINAELKMAMVMFGVLNESETERSLGILRESDLLKAEEQINDIIIKVLTAGVQTATAGSCIRCGRTAKPWHKECDGCHQSSRSTRYRKNNEEIS
jgi:ATP-dependent RNA helicase SUPV3L1/SUV3